MGQYYVAANLDKKEFLSPHACGDGAKLMEIALSTMSTMSCLAILLCDGNGRGGGDLYGATCLKCKGHGSFGDFGDEDYRVCESCKGTRREPAPEIVGSWAGDRIVLAGDYADGKRFVSDDDQKLYTERALADGQAPSDANRNVNLYHAIDEESGWKDVSLAAMRALALDPYVRQQFKEQGAKSDWRAKELAPILGGDS
jgi:hypothetical protein